MKQRWEKSAFALLSMFFFLFSGFLHPLFHAVPHAINGLSPQTMLHQGAEPDWEIHFQHTECPICVAVLELTLPDDFAGYRPTSEETAIRPEERESGLNNVPAEGRPRAPPTGERSFSRILIV